MIRAFLVAIAAPTGLAGADSEAWGQTVVHVSPGAPPGGDGVTWATAFRHPQAALEAAAPIVAMGESVHIWVAAGEYAPTARVDPTQPASATFQLLNNVSMYGGFVGTEEDLSERDFRANLTVLTGGKMAWHVVTGNGTDPSAVLDGFTIRDGLAGFDKAPKTDRGAGIVIVGGSPTVANCVVRNNRVVVLDASGGGVWSRDGAPTFIACDFIENSADAGDGGAFAFVGGAPTLVGCTFTGNMAGFAGGAIAGSGYHAVDCTFVNNIAKGGGALYGSGSFRGCRFEQNLGAQSGGAVFGRGASSFVQCAFIANTGGFDGGGVSGGETSEFVNCVFLRNSTFGLGSAVSGGGAFTNCVFNANAGGFAVFVSGLAPKISMCTFYNNDGGGVQYAGAGLVTINNSLFWQNPRDGVSDEGAQFTLVLGAASINYTFIEGLSGDLGGNGNLGGAASPDPFLLDPDGEDDTAGTLDDDLRLAGVSPCIDAGSNPGVPADTYDLDADGETDEPLPIDAGGQIRRVDTPGVVDTGLGTAPLVDIGAYEFQPGIPCPADWNLDGVVNSMDVIDFLSALFQGDADYNRNGVTNSQDYFDFMVAFFEPCG